MAQLRQAFLKEFFKDETLWALNVGQIVEEFERVMRESGEGGDIREGEESEEGDIREGETKWVKRNWEEMYWGEIVVSDDGIY